MQTHEKLTTLFREKGRGSQITLATLLNLDKGFISRWKNGSQEIPKSKLKAVADYFGVTTDYLLDEEQETPLEKVIPMIGDSTENVPIDFKKSSFSSIPIPPDTKHPTTSYAIIAKGDSMLPLIADGDIVICDKKGARNNNTIVHYTIDGKSGIKRVKDLSNESQILIADNHTNNYDNIIISKNKKSEFIVQTAVCTKIFKTL